MKVLKKKLSIISSIVFFGFFACLPTAWGQPLSMGRVELKGSARVEAGKGLVFQTPKDTEAPLMPGSKITTEVKSQALFDWTGKGSLILPDESQGLVNEKGLRLEKGAVSTRLDPGRSIVIDALNCTFTIIAPPGAEGIATVAIEGRSVRVSSETAKVKGYCRHKGAFILLAGQSGVYGSSASLLGPILFGAGVLGGIIAAASNTGGGGGGHVSPITP
jgi:hypothetical protein